MTNFRSTKLFIVFLFIVAVLLGWNYYFQPFAGKFTLTPTPAVVPSPTPAQSVETTTVTPEAKIRQLIAAPVTVDQSASSSTMLAWVTTNSPGIVTLFGDQISSEQVAQVTRALKSQTAGSMPLVAVDHEGGSVQRLNGEGLTVLPSWRELCAQPATVSGQLLTQSAQELATAGIDIVLAPVVDVSARQPVLGGRVCSGDPLTVAERGLQAAKIWQTAGIMPVLKHFPGIGETTRDLHQRFDRVTVEPEQAKVYQAILSALPRIGVMVSHVGVTNQYPDIPCSLSSVCVSELTTAFPQVLVFSDALEMKAAAYQPAASVSAQVVTPLPEIAVKAVLAGNNILIFGPSVTVTDLDQVVAALMVEYQRNGIFRDRVDQSWQKISVLKNTK